MKTPDYPDAEARRDTGIHDSAEHAEHEIPGWQDAAIECVRRYAEQYSGEPFLAEDARSWAARSGLPEPPEPRAWGAVMQATRRAGFIRRIGYAPARSSNLSPKVLWSAGSEP
jgi:hypothetical protein